MSSTAGNLDDLVEFYLVATAALLRRQEVAESVVEGVLRAVAWGGARDVHMILALTTVGSDSSPGFHEVLTSRLGALAQATDGLRGELDDDRLLSAADALAGVAALGEELGQPDLAYNLYEASYHFRTLCDAPARPIARKLRELSNPANVDQYHAAIWRVAIEQLRHSCDAMDDWTETLDSIELALNCPVETDALQAQLCQQLKRQLGRTRGTKVEELAPIFVLQSPAACIAAEDRRQGAAILLEMRIPDKAEAITLEAMEMLAAVRAQAAFDDMRQRLSAKAPVHPQLSWADASLRHERLDGALPIGNSLLVAPARTARFVLDLIHEVGHALALLGSIGAHQTVFRTVAHYLELLLIDLGGVADSRPGNVRALAALPRGECAAAAASLQLAVATKATIAQAVWTPWLEGLSMYFELLCDPRQDENEIFSVHACIRSLNDFHPVTGERTDSQTHERWFMDAAAERFDSFVSAALRSESRDAHVGYFDASLGRRGDSNALGYLVVRSVVSAWEETLQTKMAPMRAAHLLLLATQVGTRDALPDAAGPSEEYQRLCSERFIDWVRSLAALPKPMIEDLMTPVGRNDAGRQWYWDGAIPKLAPNDPEAAEKLGLEFSSNLENMLLRTALLDAEGADAQTAIHAEQLKDLFAAYVDWNRLLPIGRDLARLLLINGSAAVCPRTYIGKVSTVSGSDYRDSPRYAPSMWRLTGGKAEADRLRRLCGREGTARVIATRVLDLAGHPQAPADARTSYTCFFLGEDFARVMVWGPSEDVSGTHPEFTRILRQRVLQPPLFADEQDTLGSLEFLEKRWLNAFPEAATNGPQASVEPVAISREIALHAAAAAFAADASGDFRAVYEKAMGSNSRRHAVARALYASGLDEEAVLEPELVGTKLAQYLFQGAQELRVRPFGRGA